MNVKRIPPLDPPFSAQKRIPNWTFRGRWPANFLACPIPGCSAGVYRCRFALSSPQTLRLHAAGDNRYFLRLDGTLIANGPELGSLDHFRYESVEVELEAGEHILAALVFDFGEMGGLCRLSQRSGWLLAAESTPPELLNTGAAKWEFLPVAAWEWRQRYSVDPGTDFHGGRWPDGAEFGLAAGDWQIAPIAEEAFGSEQPNESGPGQRRLTAASLPERLYRRIERTPTRILAIPELSGEVRPENSTGEEAALLAALRDGKPYQLGVRRRIRIICDFGDYFCFYPRLTAAGAGSRLTFTWLESLLSSDMPDCFAKGNRDRIDGKYVSGLTDRFFPDHRPTTFFLPWWRCGRYLALDIECGDEAVELGQLELYETRYPFEPEVHTNTSDPRVNRLAELSIRTIQMCLHDTFMDCPYYEQLMYVGDARLEALALLALSSDNRMNEKMLTMFAESQQSDGFLCSRYPSRVRQIIPTFSPLWIGALNDYARFRANQHLVRKLFGNASRIADAFRNELNGQGLVQFNRPWCFVDWCEAWDADFGVPPEGENGVSAEINWLYAYALEQLAGLCDYLGEEMRGLEFRARKQELAKALIANFWDEDRELFSSDPGHRYYSEHSQCLALLSNVLPEEFEQRLARQLFSGKIANRTTIYFSHYYFECCRKMHRIDAMFERLNLWFDCDGLGLRTLLERPEPSRSDCHGWSGHPVFHLAATLGGIRPGDYEFRRVEIMPQPGKLTELHTGMVHPFGNIQVDYRLVEGQWQGAATLPEKLSGTVILPGNRRVELHGGVNRFQWEEKENANNSFHRSRSDFRSNLCET